MVTMAPHVLVGFLSFLPGLGQLYNGRRGRGLRFAAVWLGLVVLLGLLFRNTYFNGVLFLAVMVQLVAAVDAAIASYGDEERSRLGLMHYGALVLFVLSGYAMAVSLVFVGADRSYRMVRVTADGIDPEYQAGETLIARRDAFRTTDIQRGDVVVTRGFYGLVGRTVGLPGETVQVERGQLFVDGVRFLPGREFLFNGDPEWRQTYYLDAHSVLLMVNGRFDGTPSQGVRVFGILDVQDDVIGVLGPPQSRRRIRGEP